VGVEDGANPGAVGVYQIASAGYFTALEIPLLDGRLFDDGDDSSVADVVIVSESFAELAWPGQDPIGKRMNGGGMDSYQNPEWREGMPYQIWNRWATVVGVVADVRQRSLTRATEPTYYFHYKQRPARSRWGALMVKTGLPAASMIATLRTSSRAMDPMVPATFGLMDDLLTDSVADRRFTLLVLGAFAGLALLLSSLGIYGVVSYFVARRTREMGIRIALGANPRGVRKLVQRGAMNTVGLGLLAGVLGALMVTRLMSSLLYGISPSDPATLLGVVALLLVAAWLASYLPARRTSRIDPILTMKAE
jgi:predicted permease